MTFPVLVCAAVIVRDRRVLLARRRAGSHLAGLWEFPGGKLDPGEPPGAALVRELKEELGVTVETGRPFRFTYWEYPEKRVLILFYQCRIVTGVLQPLECDEFGWFGPEELAGLAMPPADGEVVEDVRRLLAPPGPAAAAMGSGPESAGLAFDGGG